jgi:cysteine desulfurase
MKRIYLDYAATTPLNEEVKLVMREAEDKFGNPSSIHFYGREAKAVLNEARQNIADILGCKWEEIFFTSGGTESDNLAIWGIINGINKLGEGRKPHIITSSIEHPAVYKVIKRLENEGKVSATFLGVDQLGVVDLEELGKAIKDDTVLVSIMYVNNEIGTVQPIKEIGSLLKKTNEGRKNRIYFHTDAVQAPEYFSLLVNKLGVDLLTLSSHKFGGPKGTGVLFARQNTPLAPLLSGGNQEFALRPGTENMAGAMGTAKALEIAVKNRYAKQAEKISALKDILENGIKSTIENVAIAGEGAQRSPSISNICFAGIDASLLLMNLDLRGIAVSSGSACSSGAIEISQVIKALKLKEPFSGGGIRFSLGSRTTREDIEYLLKVVLEEVEKIRNI